MKLIVLSTFLFLVLLVTSGYFLRDKEIPVLSDIGQTFASHFLGVDTIVDQSFDEPLEFEPEPEPEPEFEEETEPESVYSYESPVIDSSDNDPIDLTLEQQIELAMASYIAAAQEEINLTYGENSSVLCGESIFDYNSLAFINSLQSCTPYQCLYLHPFGLGLKKREIVGLNNEGKCVYLEGVPGPGSFTCNLSESERIDLAEYYSIVGQAEEISTSYSATFGDDGGTANSTTYVDGEELTIFSLQDALDTGVCTIESA